MSFRRISTPSPFSRRMRCSSIDVERFYQLLKLYGLLLLVFAFLFDQKRVKAIDFQMGSCSSKPAEATSKLTLPLRSKASLTTRLDFVCSVNLHDMPRSTLSNGLHFATVLDAPPRMRSSKRCLELAPYFEDFHPTANPLQRGADPLPTLPTEAAAGTSLLSAAAVRSRRWGATGSCGSSSDRRRVNFLPRVTVLEDVWSASSSSADPNCQPQRRPGLVAIDGADCGPLSTASSKMTFLTDALTHREQLAKPRPNLPP